MCKVQIDHDPYFSSSHIAQSTALSSSPLEEEREDDLDAEGESSDDAIRVSTVPPFHLRKVASSTSLSSNRLLAASKSGGSLSAAYVDDDDDVEIRNASQDSRPSATTSSLPRLPHAAPKPPVILSISRPKAAASKKPAATKKPPSTAAALKRPPAARKAPAAANKRPLPSNSHGHGGLSKKLRTKGGSISNADGDSYQPPRNASTTTSNSIPRQFNGASISAPSISRTAGKTIARSHQIPSSGGNTYLSHPAPSSGSGSGSEATTGSDESGSDAEGDGRPEGYLYSGSIPPPMPDQHYSGAQNDRASSDEQSGEQSEEESDVDMTEFASNINSELGGMGRGGEGMKPNEISHGGAAAPQNTRRSSGMSLGVLLSTFYPSKQYSIQITDLCIDLLGRLTQPLVNGSTHVVPLFV